MTRLDREVREGLYDPKKKSNYVVLFENKRLGRRDIINYSAYSKEDAERQFWRLFKPSEAIVLKVAKVSGIYAETHWLDPAPEKASTWLNFVKAHKHMKNAKGMLDLKGISKLWHARKH